MGTTGEFFRNPFEPLVDRALPGQAGVKTLSALVERGCQRAAWFYQQLERCLDEAEHLAGDRYSAADITALCTVDFGKDVGLGIPEASARGARWYSVVSARTATQV